MKNIILIGASYRGKTTLGKLLAEKMGIRHLDIDEMVMDYAIERGSPAYIFLHFGENQRRAVREVLKCDEPVVVSTGAEIMESWSEFKLLCDFGYVIHLRRSPDLSAETNSGLVLTHVTQGENGETVRKVYDHKLLIEGYEQDLPIFDEMADAILYNDGTVEEGLDKLVALIDGQR
jgi:shikimate kinase